MREADHQQEGHTHFPEAMEASGLHPGSSAALTGGAASTQGEDTAVHHTHPGLWTPPTTGMEFFIWRPPASIFMQAYPEEVEDQCLCGRGHPVRRLRPV